MNLANYSEYPVVDKKDFNRIDAQGKYWLAEKVKQLEVGFSYNNGMIIGYRYR